MQNAVGFDPQLTDEDVEYWSEIDEWWHKPLQMELDADYWASKNEGDCNWGILQLAKR